VRYRSRSWGSPVYNYSRGAIQAPSGTEYFTSGTAPVRTSSRAKPLANTRTSCRVTCNSAARRLHGPAGHGRDPRGHATAIYGPAFELMESRPREPAAKILRVGEIPGPPLEPDDFRAWGIIARVSHSAREECTYTERWGLRLTRSTMTIDCYSKTRNGDADRCRRREYRPHHRPGRGCNDLQTLGLL